MISTGDTAFVLKQHPARTASAPGLRRRFSGLPSPCVIKPLVAAHSTLACVFACAKGLKG
jgi:hypothetical protein